MQIYCLCLLLLDSVLLKEIAPSTTAAPPTAAAMHSTPTAAFRIPEGCSCTAVCDTMRRLSGVTTANFVVTAGGGGDSSDKPDGGRFPAPAACTLVVGGGGA